MRPGAAVAAGGAALAAAVAAALTPALPLPAAPGCRIFPRDNAWNRRVDGLPVAHDSKALTRGVGLAVGLHPDFGSAGSPGDRIGIPVNVVRGRQPKVRVSFDFAGESEAGPYPIPRDVEIEAGGDAHAIVVDRDACTLYELYALERRGAGWHAGSGAIWSLRSNRLRPAGWTSADAAGLPILPGLVRYDEVARGRIDHALRFTAPRTRRAYVYPARHQAGDSGDPRLPPMGLRVRLRGDFPLRGFPHQARVVLEALKRYGMLLADNGSPWYVTGVPDRRWDDDALHTLGRVKGADLEVVDASRLRPRR